MRYDSDHKAMTRERVLKEAAMAIRTDGPERVAVAAVMKRAGLTHGGFYAHFRSRDDLLDAAVTYMFDERYARASDELDADDPREALTRFVESYLSMAHRNSRAKGCPVPILAGQIHLLPEAAQARFAAAIDRIVTKVAVLLAATGLDAQTAASRSALVLAQMVGAVALSRAFPDDRAAALLEAARAAALLSLSTGASIADAKAGGGPA